MIKSDTLGKLATALSDFQGEIEDVAKDTRGQKGDYASLGAILSIVRPLLKKYRLSVSQLCNNSSADSITIETLLMHESGEFIGSSMCMPVERILTRDGRDVTNLSQAIGSCVSYARRYSLAALLGITQKDDDADSCNPNPKPEFKRTEPTRAPTVISTITLDQAHELLELIKEAKYTEDKVKAHYKVARLLDLTLPAFENCKGIMLKKIADLATMDTPATEVKNDNPQ